MSNIYLYSNDLFLQDVIVYLATKLNCSYIRISSLNIEPANDDIAIIDIAHLATDISEKELLRKKLISNSILITDKLSDTFANEHSNTLYKPISVIQLEQLCLKLLNPQSIDFANHILEVKTSSVCIIANGLCTHKIRLTAKEFALLLHIACNDASLSKNEILERVFGYKDAKNTHTLEVHFSRLKYKLAPYIDLNNYIKGIL